MQILRNCWYMIAWEGDLRPGSRQSLMVANESLVIERADDGEISVRSATADAVRYAVATKHRMVWVWLGDAAHSDGALIPDFSCFDGVKETAFFSGYLPTDAHYELLSDNILDLSHADYLHPDTLGGGVFTRNPPKLKREGLSLTLTWEALNDVALPILDRLLPEPGQPAHVKMSVRWDPAAVMLLRAQVAPAGEPLEKWFDGFAAHIMTPESDQKTHYFYGAVRNYFVDDAEFNAFQAKVIGQAFATEDKPLIEAQQRAMGEADFWDLRPILLSIDAGAVQARRTLSRLIKQESQSLASA